LASPRYDREEYGGSFLGLGVLCTVRSTGRGGGCLVLVVPLTSEEEKEGVL